MKLNASQLEIMKLASSRIEITPKDIGFLSGSIRSTYVNELARGGFLEKKGLKFTVSENRFARLLVNILNDDPSLIAILKNEGIPILMNLMNAEYNQIDSLARATGLGTSSVYPYIRKMLQRQMIHKEEGHLLINRKLWNELYEFISLYKTHCALKQFDEIPNNAKIYFESPYEVIFSLPTEYEGASKTAFSAYGEYGIKLFEKEIFYRVDEHHRKKLDPQTILLDSLRISGSEVDSSIRRKMYSFLFYRKNITHLKKTKHPDLDLMKDIVRGKGRVKNTAFPTYEELVEKGADYDIKI
jgi:hypothetical protein